MVFYIWKYFIELPTPHRWVDLGSVLRNLVDPGFEDFSGCRHLPSALFYLLLIPVCPLLLCHRHRHPLLFCPVPPPLGRDSKETLYYLINFSWQP